MKKIIVFLFVIGISFSSLCQEDNKEISTLVNQAEVNINHENYSEAKKNLAFLIEKGVKDEKILLLYAECILMDDANKSKGIKILESILSDLKGKQLLNAKTLLAKLYQQEYQFDKAIQLYSDLDTLITLNALTTNYKVLIAQCESAKLLMKNIQSIQVQPIKTTTSNKVVQDYNKIVGRKLSSKRKYKNKPASMSTFEGQKKKEQLSILEVDGGDIRIYPEFKGNKHGTIDKDLVIEHKEHGTGWYNREFVSNLVNSDFDEDYPYLSLDNQTLYFCSNGPESMGGYDIFRCQRDTVTGYWGKPINMGFPINSTADEFLFVEDSVDMVAYFASSRFSAFGEVTVYQMPIKKAYSANSSFFVNREIKNNDSLWIENLALARLNDFKYVFVGGLDPVKNRILYTVEELEQLSLVFSLSNGENYEFELFSPAASNSKEVSYTLVYENSSVKLRKNSQDNSTGNPQLLGMLSGQESHELNKNKVANKVSLTERSDSLNFSNISTHLKQAKQKLIVKEARFSSFMNELNETSSGFGNWIFANNSSIKGSRLEERQKAERYFNQVVAASKVYEQEKTLLEIAREEVILLEEVEFVMDSMARMTNMVLKERKKEKLFIYFKEKYEVLNKRFETATGDYYAYLKTLRDIKDRLDLDKKSLQEIRYYNVSRKALLLEERKVAVRELENAWWRRKKRKMTAIISDIDIDISNINREVAKDSLLDSRRSKAKDYMSMYYEAKDWKYLNNEIISLKISPNLDMGILDSSRKQIDIQFNDFVNSEEKIPTTFSLIDTKEELVDTSSNYVFISDLRKVNWNAFDFNKEKTSFVSSSSNIDTSVIVNVMESVQKELVQEDKALFRTHTVSLKETIYSIARQYNVTAKEIITWNSYSENNLEGINWSDSTRTGRKKNWVYVGEKLRVVLKYKVKSGDTLKKIAAIYGCSVADIKKWNTLSVNHPIGIDWSSSRRTGDKYDWLYVGENLIIGLSK